MVEITFYDSDEEMWDDLGRAMKEADAKVKPTQTTVEPGDCFINFRYGKELPIFGEILDVKTLGYDKEEQEYLDDVYGQPHMKCYRPTKAFSVACDYGECGDIHLSEISAIIDRELFEFYRDNGWVKPWRGDDL